MTTTSASTGSLPFASQPQPGSSATPEDKPNSLDQADTDVSNALTSAQTPVEVTSSTDEQTELVSPEVRESEYYTKAYQRMFETGKRPSFPKGAFCYFSSIRRTEIRASQPGLPQPKIFKAIRSEWRKMTEHDKQHYQVQAKRDYEDYRKLLSIWDSQIKPEAPPEATRGGLERFSKAEGAKIPESYSVATPDQQLQSRRCPIQHARYPLCPADSQSKLKDKRPHNLESNSSHPAPAQSPDGSAGPVSEEKTLSEGRKAGGFLANKTGPKIIINFPHIRPEGGSSTQSNLKADLPYGPRKKLPLSSAERSDSQAQAPQPSAGLGHAQVVHVLNRPHVVGKNNFQFATISASSHEPKDVASSNSNSILARVPFLDLVARGDTQKTPPQLRSLPKPSPESHCLASSMLLNQRKNKFQLAARRAGVQFRGQTFQANSEHSQPGTSASEDSESSSGASLSAFIKLGKREFCKTTSTTRATASLGILKRQRQQSK